MVNLAVVHLAPLVLAVTDARLEVWRALILVSAPSASPCPSSGRWVYARYDSERCFIVLGFASLL